MICQNLVGRSFSPVLSRTSLVDRVRALRGLPSSRSARSDLPFCPPRRLLRTQHQTKVVSGATAQRTAGMAQQQHHQHQGGSGGGAKEAGMGQQQEQQDARKSLLPICFRDGQITVGDGLPVLDKVTHQASIQRDGDIMVLSLRAKNGPASLEDIPLGQLHCLRWLCCARNKLFWMTPEWGTTTRELPPETQFLLLELEDETYAIILPLIDRQTFRGTLRPPRKGTPEHAAGALIMRMESGSDSVLAECWDDAVLLAAGTDPFELVEAAVTAAAAISGGSKPLREKQLPPSLDVFGWCSWDAFYTTVSPQGLNQAVASLAAGGTPPRWVVIDDGWQCTDLDEPFRQAPSMMPPLTKELSDTDTLESYMEGEIEMLGMAAKDIPAGTATGSIMHEVMATQSMDYAGYHSLVQQRAAQPAQLPLKRPHLLARVSSGILEYFTGVFVGIFQALILTIYQRLVDPAPPDSWTVRAFRYLSTGPLKQQMLSFYAVSTAFTRRLTDVRANSKFCSPDGTPEDISSGKPENLAWVVSNLKLKYGVKYIYCWHGLPAYWAGVAPDAPAVAKYRAQVRYGKGTPGLHEIEPSIAWNPATLGGIGMVLNPHELYNDMHHYLKMAGVSGVKVDCQAGMGLAGDVDGGGPANAHRFHTALEDSVKHHFPDNSCINCMCHSTENIYRWRDTAVARASDDFYPTDKASYMPHLLACSFNALFLSPLALPDWDMFHSKHEAAELHAVARAVSGGPVYVSDPPGHHDHELLRRLVLPDGTVLRGRLPGRPTRDSLFADVARDGRSLLKVWNMNSCNGVVGVLNLQGSSWDRARRRFHIHNASPPTLSTTVRVADIEPFRAFLEAAGCAPAAMARGPAESTDVPHTSLGNGNGALPVHGSSGVGGSGAASESVPLWVVHVGSSGALHRVRWDEGIGVTLKGGKGAVVTVAPILSFPSGLEVSPLGFSNMLNGGSAVVAVRCLSGAQGDAGQGPAGGGLWGGAGSNGASAALLASGGASMLELVAGAGAGADIAVQLRGCGTFLAYCNRAPARCWLAAAAGNSGGHGSGGANMIGSGGSLATASLGGSGSLGSGSGGEDEGEPEGPPVVSVDFKYADGRLEVEVPWKEGSEGQFLLLAFTP